MDRLFEAVLFYDDLPDDRKSAVRKQLADHPDLQDTLVQWMQVRAAVRHELEADLPDRDLLVLYALDDAGLGDSLSAPEQRSSTSTTSRTTTTASATPRGTRSCVRRPA